MEDLLKGREAVKGLEEDGEPLQQDWTLRQISHAKIGLHGSHPYAMQTMTELWDDLLDLSPMVTAETRECRRHRLIQTRYLKGGIRVSCWSCYSVLP